MSRQLYLTMKGVNPLSCHKTSLDFVPPVPFIPSNVESLLALGSTKEPHSMKIKHQRHGQLEETVPMFGGGDREAHLLFIEMVESLCDRRNYHTQQQGYHQEVINAQEDLFAHDLSKPDESHKFVDSIAEDGTKKKGLTSTYEDWINAKNLLDDRIANAKAKEEEIVHQHFDMYENLMDVRLRKDWQTEVEKACHTYGWIDEDGQTHKDPRGYTYEALEICRRNWQLATVFRKDDAEKQTEYMQFYIKAGPLATRPFCQRMQQVNAFIPRLPCLKDCEPTPNEYDRANESFSEQKLAVICLRALPRKLQKQYNAQKEGRRPTNVAKLIEAAESLEPLFDTKPASNTIKATTIPTKMSGTGAKRSTNTPKGGPKSKKPKRFCDLCHEFGGAENTHDTTDCQKWLPGGKENPNFRSRRRQKTVDRTKNTNAHVSTVVQQPSAIATAVQAAVHEEIKKLKKSSYFHASEHHGKRKKHHGDRSGESVSSDSNSR